MRFKGGRPFSNCIFVRGGFAKRKNDQKCVRKKDEVGGLGLVLFNSKLNLFPYLVNSGKFIVL